MKSTNALVAAALAGVFAAGTTVSTASQLLVTPVAAEKEKEKCDGKDGCPGKEKKEDKEALAAVTGADKDKEKEKCDGKDSCPAKDNKQAEIL